MSDEIPVCPECDGTNIRPIVGETQWYCRDCQYEYDSVCWRQRRNNGMHAKTQLKKLGVDTDELEWS